MIACLFEDDIALARLIEASLSEICKSVHHSETLADFKSHRASLSQCPGLVWMDVRAPGNTPQEVFDEIRDIRECCPHAIIVVVSGMPTAEAYEFAMAAGADYFESKPFKISALAFARIIGVGAINAMERGSSDALTILQNVCSMACKYFQSR